MLQLLIDEQPLKLEALHYIKSMSIMYVFNFYNTM